MKRIILVCAALMFGLLVACSPSSPTFNTTPSIAPGPPVYTASFECQNGNTPVQNAVCENQQLAGLDVQLGAVYRQHIGTDSVFERDQVMAAQRAWLLGLQSSCNVTSSPNAPDPATASCLASAYQAQIATLTNWPAPQDTTPDDGSNNAITNYVHYALLDNKQPALCGVLNAQAAAAMSANGAIDPTRLAGAQEIAGTHGTASGQDPQGGTITVNMYRAGLYGGYEKRAQSVTLSGAASAMLDSYSVGNYVVTMPNGGGRFESGASQTNDYGSIDVFTLNGQLVALMTDVIGYNSPAPPGEVAVAALFTINQGVAAPACLFSTYVVPPTIAMGTFSEQPSLSPFMNLVDSIDSTPPAELPASDRQDTDYIAHETCWMILNMPQVVLEQARAGSWTGWLRSRHDEVLDTLFAWSQQSPTNQAAFNKLFGLLRPAALDLDTIFVQQQGLTATDAEQATAIAMMELLYQSTINLSPGLGSGPADPAGYQTYQAHYPILATPQS